MTDSYLQYPSTIRELVAELKKACDDYFARRITNKEIKEIVLWYATSAPDKLFHGEEFNPTVTILLGKKRIRLITDLLDGYQQMLI